MKPLIESITRCRACGSRKLKLIWNFGQTPLANTFLKNSNQRTVNREQWFPLKVKFCQECNLVQLADVVDPELLFKDYVYLSSTASIFVAHFENLAKTATRKLKLTRQCLVIDIGSNDGILLKPFAKRGIRVLGIEPATKIARQARQNGIPTLAEFFNLNLVKRIIKKYGQADLITATNVFAHIDDLDTVLTGVKQLLSRDGVFMIEAPYLVNFLKQNLFDTVYHEHLSYLAVKPLKVLVERLGLKIWDVEKVPTHGGSMRVWVKKPEGKWPVTSKVNYFIKQEKQQGLDQTKTYHNFLGRVKQNKRELVKLLNRFKRQGKKIVGFGAPAKGNTLLNYFGIDNKLIDYIVDDSPWKQGLFTPGTHIPVVAPAKIYEDKPDYILILAWNFAKPIMEKYHWFKKLGGKFIIPIPKPRIVG